MGTSDTPKNSASNFNDYTIRGIAMGYANTTLHELFESCSAQAPRAFALQYGEKRLTYAELSEHSNRTAHYLWSQGVRPGQTVAISLERTPNLIASLFAILQCGACYLPIDTSYPNARIEFMIADSKADYFIGDKQTHGLEYSGTYICINDVLKGMRTLSSEPLEIKTESNAPCYIIYTSGSTGKPKGVQVAHRNVVNLVDSLGKAPGIDPIDKIFAVTTISFDAMVMEIFLPLLHGACVVLVDEDTRRDGQKLLEKAKKDGISVMWGTPSIWQILLNAGWDTPLDIKILIGGEPVPLTLARELLPRCGELWNIYGPTETTVCAFTTRITADSDPITIGKPIANTYAYLLDTDGKPVPPGEIGEIAIGGDGVSLGYLDRPELTGERFIIDPFSKKKDAKIYLTGDFGKLSGNGEVQCLGRADGQVKIRGHRIEIGEIEGVLESFPTIKRACVTVNNGLNGEPRLIAYLQANTDHQDTEDIRRQLEETLPDFMLPSFFMWMKDFPVTVNGKIDTARLPFPEYVRPDSAPLLRKPRTPLEKQLAQIWAEQLHIQEIGIDDNFFELGGTSLLSQKTITSIRQNLDLEIPVTGLYRFPTIASLSENIAKDGQTLSRADVSNRLEKKISEDIAIIGMAGRFPGAETIPQLWEVLRDGKETTSFFTSEELDKNIPESLRNDPNYVSARGILPSAKTFDAAFFGLNPKVAEAMDPQQRLFLEIAYEVLEQAGHLPRHYGGSIGVYAGTGTNTYYKNNVLPNKNLLDAVGHLQADTLNEKDYIASRTAYHLNLKGPAVSVQSACSTSLLAIAEAVEALRNGQCDVALAGGSSITAPMSSGHLYQEGSMLSADGHCRSFDAKGKGTVFSDGAGVVLLKTLEAAQKDGDTIYGTIKGIGLSNDGGSKGSFTAPSADGQAGAIGHALRDAKVSASTISYVEAHGTATPLGDPIEIEGLKMAFGKQDKNGYCALGSIKSNMGHLTAAAGVAGLIKTVLALHHKQIPASLGFEHPNPAIDFDTSPFFMNKTLRGWDVDGVRRAGVSSFGVGGTNVHVVLEEYAPDKKVSDPGRALQLIAWSAKTGNSLAGYGHAMGEYLNTAAPSVPLADVAYSLSTTRDSFAHRRFIVAGTNQDAAQELSPNAHKNTRSHHLKVVPSETVFLFPGQGSQYVQMGRALYDQEPVFRQAVDACAHILIEYIEVDIRQILFPDIDMGGADAQLRDTRFAQPALFVIEYAMAQLWMAWGIKPTAFCGHSIGEFVAAHLAGIFSLSDALRLIALRGSLVSGLPQGSMLSVRLQADRLKEILPENLSIAAINSDKACVVSGSDQAIAAFAQKMDAEVILHRALATSHAFHSAMMDPILESFGEAVQRARLNAPRLPIVSTVTGTWLTHTEAVDPDYWTNHLRATVCFSRAMDTILEKEDTLLLEVGPGNTLSALARQKRPGHKVTSLASLPRPENREGGYSAVLHTLGQLWLHGLEPDWPAFYAGQIRQKLALPSYVFDRKPCWVEPLAPKPFHAPEPSSTTLMHTTLPIEEHNSEQRTRKSALLEKISEIIENSSGIELEFSDYQRPFLELGLDSLVLTQMAILCKKEFDLPITFRQLNEQLATPELLAEYLDEKLPSERYAQAVPIATNSSEANVQAFHANQPSTSVQHSQLNQIADQLQLLSRQLDSMRGGSSSSQPSAKAYEAKPLSSTPATVATEDLSEEDKTAHKKPFGASPKIEHISSELSDGQQSFLTRLIERYTLKTKASKTYSQKHRAGMADPRVVSGFKPLTKELVYPLVVERSSGSRLWDLDGNEYLDALNGFGSCFFGHQPDFVKSALKAQIELGYEVGPQHPLAGEVCDLLCEATGHDRSALCNTGSEAVLGAMRIARTVTGRSLIVTFTTSYHGINDEAIVRGSRKMKTFPAAAGIQPEAVQNMLVLEYGTAASLEIIRNRAHELAAVLVEPVQSRRPEFRPIDFLKEVREITTAAKTVLIFDEIITGFRMHRGGVQALFDIRADLATYGKVMGGGLPIGAICGKTEYMDALDGGFWQYGDDSSPEVGVTYFAGTFVRHPLALAACKAALQHLAEKGNSLQVNLADMTEGLANTLNTGFTERGVPIRVTYFGSLWRMQFLEDIAYSELLFVLLREKGIHIWDGFPCFLTTVNTKEDVSKITSSVLESLDELVAGGFFPEKSIGSPSSNGHKKCSKMLNTPPILGARLGRDEEGYPAWYLPDGKKEDQYIKMDL